MSAALRYSKVSRRIWNDRKFRGLSPIPPCAAGLVLRLLTAPECTCIPGLFQAWEAGLAQSLGWSLEAFREAFREASSAGLVKADWRVGLVWLPNAVKHNEPASPNVIRSWGEVWNELPECDLKDEAYHGLKAFVEGMSEGFVKAFREALGEARRHPSPNQEQEQDQDQEQEDPDLIATTRDLSGSARAVAPEPPPAATPGKIPCPADLRLTEGQRATLETSGGVPGWAIDRITTDFVSRSQADDGDRRPLAAWRKCLSAAVNGNWHDPAKRPKPDEPPPAPTPALTQAQVDAAIARDLAEKWAHLAARRAAAGDGGQPLGTIDGALAAAAAARVDQFGKGGRP